MRMGKTKMLGRIASEGISGKDEGRARLNDKNTIINKMISVSGEETINSHERR